MNVTSAAVKVEGLRKRYRRSWFGRGVDALQGVSFEVPRGQIFGLLGPNGAGKTTVIKILLGIVRASAGTTSLLGYPPGDARGRAKVGYLPENLQLPAHQTASSALEYYGRLSNLPYSVIRHRGAELLERVGLAGREAESVRQYSKGMKQRLGLAQALLHDPELLILDEPTDGLDPVGRAQVRQILKQLSQEGRTVFVNSHLLQEVELVCDRVAIMNHGQLRYVGDVGKHVTANGSGATQDTIAQNGANTDASSNVELLLISELSKAQGVLATWNVVSWNPIDAAQVRVVVAVRDQSDTDGLVDVLRREGIGIASLAPQRTTLEELFLRVIEQQELPG